MAECGLGPGICAPISALRGSACRGAAIRPRASISRRSRKPGASREKTWSPACIKRSLPTDGYCQPSQTTRSRNLRESRRVSRRCDPDPKVDGSSWAKRDFLVFVQADIAFDRGFLHEPREFDVLLNYYAGFPEILPADVEIAISQRGTKTTAIHKLLDTEPQLLLEYDAVLFLDNDIAIGAPDIERLFAIMREQNLDLRQASLSAESDCVWPVFKQPSVGDGVRRVNSVEIMMPCLSRPACLTRPAGHSRSRSVASASTYWSVMECAAWRRSRRCDRLGCRSSREENRRVGGRVLRLHAAKQHQS